MAIGEIYAGQPNSLTAGAVITDVQGLDMDESGSNFAHYGDDKAVPQDGGANTDVAISGSFRTRNVDDAFAVALQIGKKVTNLVALLAGKGTAFAKTCTITIATARITGRSLSGDDRKEVTVSFDAFSVDGTTWPVTYVCAA